MHAGVGQNYVAAAGAAMHHVGAGVWAIVGLFIIAVVVIVLAIIALTIIGIWKVFVKAGQPGWASIIPVYNVVKMLEIVSLPLWLVVLCFLPLVNTFVSVVIAYRLSRGFGHGVWFTIGMICLPFIFYPILGLGSSRFERSAIPQGMSEATKWTLIGAAVLGAMYFAFIFLAPTGMAAYPRVGGLMVIDGGSGFATDGTHVYLDDQVIPGADPDTFAIQGDYELDQYSVYYQGQVLLDASPSTFTVLNDGAYAYDDNAVYYDGSVISAADPSTFKGIDGDYAEDASHVYYDGEVIADADPASFTVLDIGYAKDATAVYFEGSVLPGADPKTFTTFAQTETVGGKTYDAKDKNHYYNYGQDALAQ